MGGIADYSGSLVLQVPIEDACFAAVQLKQLEGKEGERRGAVVKVSSFRKGQDGERSPHVWEAPVESLRELQSYSLAEEYFKKCGAEWAAYVCGALVVLNLEGLAPISQDVDIFILIFSNVPEGKGVASSAAVEVSTMKALDAALELHTTERDLALLCQMVENRVVGAPCGVMDQMASALGAQSHLLPILCRPADVQEAVPIPPHVRFYGIDSGLKHSVKNTNYTAARIGAFMGLKIIQNAQNTTRSKRTCLASISPSEFLDHFESVVPNMMSGKDFISQHGPHIDTATAIDPVVLYDIRNPTAHPIWENFRVHAFRELLLAPPTRNQLVALGELMFQSHASYKKCGLGSDGTDLIVDLVRRGMEASSEGGVFGARSTGAGCGGTVCVLASGDDKGRVAVEKLGIEYRRLTGRDCHVFGLSTSGAPSCSCMRIRWAADVGNTVDI